MKEYEACQVFSSKDGIQLKIIKRASTQTYYVEEVTAKKGGKFLIADEPDCEKACRVLVDRKKEFQKMGMVFELSFLKDG